MVEEAHCPENLKGELLEGELWRVAVKAKQKGLSPVQMRVLVQMLTEGLRMKALEARSQVNRNLKSKLSVINARHSKKNSKAGLEIK